MKRVWEVLSTDFPVTEKPYEDMARTIGIDAKELTRGIEALKKSGHIRRIAAIVPHRAASYEGNAMVVWCVGENAMEEAARVMAEFPEVSHCYERDTGGYWPYNLYTMVHGRTRQECLATIERMALRSGITDRKVLFSVREFKKTSFMVGK